MCVCPNTGIAPLDEDCLSVELSRSLGTCPWVLCSPANAFRPNTLWPVTVVEAPSKHSSLTPSDVLLDRAGLNSEALLTAFPLSMPSSHLVLVFIFLPDPPPPPPRHPSALPPSPPPPPCAPSARPTATRPLWTLPSCRKRPPGHGKPRQNEPRLTTTSTPQSCPAGPTSSSRLRPLKPWSRDLCPPPLVPPITMAGDRGKASSTTTLWTSSTQPQAPSSTAEKRVKANALPCRSRSSEHLVRAL